ncbi:MAG TPA: glycosyltransferase family 87 protein, partial [Patescibacteria group bacterium]|nr:glycosyltransferase family 87 protein [Patescibacteria group bacterium]
MKKYFSPSKLRWVLYIAFGEAIALFTILSIVFVILPFSSNRYIRGSDYVSYVTGAAIVRDGKGSTLYDIDTQTVYQRELVKPYRKQIILPYRYLPFLALFFVPFSWLDFRVGYFVYLGIQLLLVGLLSVFVIRIFRRVGRFVWAVLVPFSLLPISDSILWGQVTVFLTLVYFVFYWLETKGKSLLAGMVAGLFLIKPHLYLVGLPFWVLSSSRKKFFFFGNLLTVSVFLFISFFISGVGVFKYPDFLFLT